LETHRISGTQTTGGTIQLSERVIGYANEGPRQHEKDLIVKVEVEGKEIYFGKAKYPEAKLIGFKKDDSDLCSYIDQIEIKESLNNVT